MTAAALINKTELGQWTWPSLLLTLGFSLQAWPLTTVCGGPELQFIIYVYNAKQKLSAAHICSRSIGTIILSPLFLHGVSTEHQLWWQNKHFQVPHTSHKVDGALVAKLCPALATPWTIAHPALLSMGFPRQEFWVGCHFLLYRIFSTQGLPNHDSCIAGRFFTTSHLGSPSYKVRHL